MSVAAELCADCGHAGIEPRGFCPRCGSRTVRAGTISGDGRVRSVTTVHRPPLRDGGAGEPYAVGLIALAAGPRLMARLLPGTRIGDAITVSRPALASETTTTANSPN